MENIKSKANDIKENIKSLKKELLEIQTSCSHEKLILRYNEDSKTVFKICSECEKIIGYPTKDELEKNDYL